MRPHAASLLALCLCAAAAPRHFEFAAGRAAPLYNSTIGAGFDLGSEVRVLPSGGVTGDKPFFFSVDVPEGNWNVTVKLAGGVATLRAEDRRLLAEDLQSSPRTFTINVRYPEIREGERVRLKPREIGALNWDHKLTLEFNGARPVLQSIDLERAEDAATIYLAGDSTVVDQQQEPWAAWGQMLPRFFQSGIAVSNQAESGEALKSFLGEKRLEKILSTMKKGDYLFIQFTHNDQKPGGAYVEPFTTYKDHLKLFINETRKRGAFPVLVTSMHRRTFDEEGHIRNSLGDYPEAMRQTAKEDNVPLIDLTAMSKLFYEALGPEKSVRAFVHYPAGAFPNQAQELKDDTHFNSYGAYELAKCIVAGIRSNRLPLAKYLLEGLPAFDPSHPDDVETFHLPPSPFVTLRKPDGN